MRLYNAGGVDQWQSAQKRKRKDCALQSSLICHFYQVLPPITAASPESERPVQGVMVAATGDRNFRREQITAQASHFSGPFPLNTVSTVPRASELLKA